METIFDVGDTEPSCQHHVRIDFQLREAEEIHVRTWSESQIAPSGINDKSLLQPSSLRTAKRPTLSSGSRGKRTIPR